MRAIVAKIRAPETSGGDADGLSRVRDGRLRTNIGNVATLDGAGGAFGPTERVNGQTIVRIRR